MVITELCVCAVWLENVNVYIGTCRRENNCVVKQASLIIGNKIGKKYYFSRGQSFLERVCDWM